MHRAIFNNMLMVLRRMNERTKELLPLVLLLRQIFQVSDSPNQENPILFDRFHNFDANLY